MSHELDKSTYCVDNIHVGDVWQVTSGAPNCINRRLEVLGFNVKGTSCKIRYDHSGRAGWWLITSIKKYGTLRVGSITREPPPAVQPAPSEGLKSIRFGEAYGMSQGKLNEILNKEETKMLDNTDIELKCVEFIGDRKAEELSDSQVLKVILDISDRINKLEDLGIDSEKVSEEVDKLKDERVNLIDYLDGRESE